MENEINACEMKMERAVRLIEKLSGERERWGFNITKLSKDMANLLGDILLSAGVVSYMGNFTGNFRDMIVK